MENYSSGSLDVYYNLEKYCNEHNLLNKFVDKGNLKEK